MQKASGTGALCSLPRSPGTLHESVLLSSYHCLPCSIVSYEYVSESLRRPQASQGGDLLCVPSASLNSALTRLTFTELTPGPWGQGEGKGHIRESKHLPVWLGDP